MATAGMPAGARGPVRAPRVRMPAGAMGPVNRKGGPRGFRQTYKEMPIETRQKWLRKLGYNIAVDGVLGPQTKAATKAFLNGTKARFFNKKIGGASGASHPADLNPGSAPVGGGGGGGGGGRGRGRVRVGGGGGRVGQGDVKSDLFDLINPRAYARGSVEAEYGPLLGQIGRDITQGRAQGRQNQADIASWFQQLEGTRAAGAQANAGALQEALGGFDTAQQGIMNALGGGEQAAVASGYGAAARAGLAGQGQAQGDFDRRMAAILQSQGADARLTEQGRQSQIMADLLGKRQDLFKSKGSAFAKALAEAQILRTQQRGQNIEQQNMLAQMGLNEREFGLKSRLAQQEMAMNRQKMGYEARNQRFSEQERQLDYDVKRAQYEDFLDQLKTSKGGNIDFGTLDEQSRLGLAKSIQSMAAGPGGRFVGSVPQAWKKIQDGLRMAGYNVNDPAIKRFGLGILRTIPGYGRANRARKKNRR